MLFGEASNNSEFPSMMRNDASRNLEGMVDDTFGMADMLERK